MSDFPVVINIFAVILPVLSVFICLLTAIYLFKLHKSTKVAMAIHREKEIAAAVESNDKDWVVIMNQIKEHERQRDKK